MDDKLPRKIGRYEAISVIGRGGVGTVYRGIDKAIDRIVAIKVLHSQGGRDPERFLQEARTVGRLNHPNIATLYDVGHADGGEIFIVQEFLDSLNLARVISRHATGIKPTVAIGLLLQIARALAYAHDQGVVHRDIKPGNVAVLSSGVAKLLDFGIARIVHEPSEITIVGEMVGTPMYMSPESIQSQQSDHRSDIYSFGVLAFELLTGHTPYAADSNFQLMRKILEEPVPSIQSRVPGCPQSLAELVESCLAKDPNERPQSMRVVEAALSALENEWDASLLGKSDPTGDALDVAATSPVTDSFVSYENYENSVFKDPITETGIVSSGPIVPAPAKKSEPYSSFPNPHTTLQGVGTAKDLIGQTIGRFMLHERVARGHSGDLYKAWDPVRGELVGLKVVFARDADAKERLLRGGRIWINLHHPHIVRVLEVHPDNGDQPGLIVTEMIDGTNLEKLASQRYLTFEEIVWIVMQVCDALMQIHRLGVVHREVKPRNIIISGDDLHVTLLDSGIARHANPEVDAFTKTGIFVGDLAYAAPEQAHGRVDQRTDVFAVVAILYELITRSKLPFPAPSDWRPNSAILDGLPFRIRTVIERGLRHEPDERFATIGELHDQLRGLAPNRTRRAIGSVVVALHGIRTQAAWQRAFSEVAGRAGLSAHVDRWNFGYFSALRFVMPWARLAKVRWFRETYQQEFREANVEHVTNQPSIVAHSFGTYILGNALLRYPYLRFNKVLLCGSILPTDFPWNHIIDRGQVQAVRNEYGSEDIWTKAVGWFVPATGPSGLTGFTAQHPRLEQERFDFAHSEYFERGHMDNRWLPYLAAQVSQRPVQDIDIPSSSERNRPWGLYSIYILIVIIGAAVVATFKD